VPASAQKSKTKDAVQMKLRDHKKRWSAATSALIARIIDFKRGINGRGAAKESIPPSSIKDALPEQVSSALSQLSSDFQKIVSDAEAIISEQAQYSQTRRKRQPKHPKAPAAQPGVPAAAPTPAPGAPGKVVEQLQRLTSLEIYGIEKYGSTRLTRFWQYLTSVFSRQEFNRQRLGLLSLSADLFYNTLDFQNAVLTLGVKNIPQSISKYQNLQNTYKAVNRLFNQVAKLLVDQAEDEGVKLPLSQAPEPQGKPKKSRVIDLNEPTQTSQISRDLDIMLSLTLINPDKIYSLKELIKRDPKNTNVIQGEYNKILRDIIIRAQQEYGPTQIKTLQDIVELARKNAQTLDTPLAKYAHNAITRALRRQLVKVLPFDKTAAPRLQSADIANEMKKTIKRLMDVLEKDISVDEIVELLKEIEKQIVEIGRYMSVLNLLYKTLFLQHDKDRDLDMALRRKLRRDIFKEIE
jgi:hypothetical protein